MDKPLFNRLEKTPAYKVVSDALEQAILQRQIKTGDALPTEENLATQFGVNRSTVREGIRHMEQTGFVQRKGKKLIVSRPSYDLVGHQMSKVLILNDVTFEELWQVKMVLEPLSAQLAATNASDDLINRMAKNIEVMTKALENEEDLVALDIEFHVFIAEAANNQALVMAREALAQLFYPAYQASMFSEVSGQRLLDAHKHIFKAIKNRDPVTAGEWMRKHIIDFKRGYEIAGLDANKPVSNDTRT
ncbi:MAG: FCD domain-containing protein [Sneathiella sp.]